MAGSKDGGNYFRLELHGKLFDILCRLPLVQHERFMDIKAVHVQLHLTDMGVKRILDAVPQVINRDFFFSVGSEHGVVLHADSSYPHTFDFNDSLAFFVFHDGIGMSDDAVLFVHNRHLILNEDA